MGLYDRDYVHEKKTAHNKKATGDRTGGTSKPGADDRRTRPAQTSHSTTGAPPSPDWKTIVLWASLAANVMLLTALVILHGR